MTEPSAKIILDSISPRGDRLTTMEVVCHRFVLAEFNTHRKFSRNSASSRAIPVEKQIQKVLEDPAIPVSFPAEQRGMQGGDELEGEARILAVQGWKNARMHAINAAETMAAIGVHKSVVNRVLEPFMWHTILVSSTEWENFWRQRISPLAQPEIHAAADAMHEQWFIENTSPEMQVIAELMYKEHVNSVPQRLDYDEPHTPYIQGIDREIAACQYSAKWQIQDHLMKISAARCGRVSYLTQDGRRDHIEDIKLYWRFVKPDNGPPHASPLEHVAKPCPFERVIPDSGHMHRGNFDGYDQMRHSILGF